MELLVLDLDMTLLNTHLPGQDSIEMRKTDVNKFIDKYVKRVRPEFLRYIETLKIPVAIATFNDNKEVASIVSIAFTEANLDPPVYVAQNKRGGNKNEHLQEIQSKTNIDFSRMLFYDDDLNNVERAREIGVLAVHFTDDSLKPWKAEGDKRFENVPIASDDRTLRFDEEQDDDIKTGPRRMLFDDEEPKASPRKNLFVIDNSQDDSDEPNPRDVSYSSPNTKTYAKRRLFDDNDNEAEMDNESEEFDSSPPGATVTTNLCTSALENRIEKLFLVKEEISACVKSGSSKKTCKREVWKNLCDLLNKAFQLRCTSGWTIGKFLGNGASGIVYAASSNTKTEEMGSCKVIFTQFEPESEKRETLIQEQANKAMPRIVPKVYAKCFEQIDGGMHVGLIFMEQFLGPLQDWEGRLPDDLFINLLQTMKNSRFCHGDLHFNNITYELNEKGEIEYLKIFDFGRATFLPSNLTEREMNMCYTLDIIILLRSVMIHFINIGWKNEFQYWKDDFLEEYNLKGFKVELAEGWNEIPNDLSEIRELQHKQIDQYACLTNQTFAGFGEFC